MYDAVSSSASFENVALVLLASILPLALTLGLYLLLTIAWCKLFKKAGLPWERVFVPFYGAYWRFKLVGCQAIYWITLVSIVVVYAGSILAVAVSSAGGDTGYGLLMVSGLLMLAWLVGLLVMWCVYCSRMAKAFGKGIGFTLGLIFLFVIFLPILGFGSAKYRNHPAVSA